MNTDETDEGDKIGENLATGLAIAQASVQTTGMDSRNQFSKYDYTGLGTIFAMARMAFQAGNLSFRIGKTWVVFSDGEKPSMLHGMVHISHKSGECLEPYETSMAIIPGKKPFDNALRVARTILRRYAVVDILGMGWDKDPDDVDQFNPANYVDQSPGPSPKIETPGNSGEIVYWNSEQEKEAEGDLRSKGREALSNLKRLLGPETTNDMAVTMALGGGANYDLTNPSNELIHGLIIADGICSRFTTDGPKSHGDLKLAASETGVDLLWIDGECTVTLVTESGQMIPARM